MGETIETGLGKQAGGRDTEIGCGTVNRKKEGVRWGTQEESAEPEYIK